MNKYLSLDLFSFSKNDASKLLGVSEIFGDLVGFRDVREADSFHVAYVHLKRTSWCRVTAIKPQSVNEC